MDVISKLRSTLLVTYFKSVTTFILLVDRQEQKHRDHEVRSQKVVAQDQGYDCEAKISQGPRQGCHETRCNHYQVSKAPSTTQRKQNCSQKVRVNVNSIFE